MSSPQSFAHYTVSEKIGAGGMGEVFRATDSKLNRDVALKMLPDTLIDNAERLARFQREAQVLAQLNASNGQNGRDRYSASQFET
jgi:serine/threonine-protein kinase